MTLKIRRKTQQCLNCGLTLNTVYHYCPRCGQENNDNNVSFVTFVREFFANYISFDTRFGHSLVPFLIKPGYLTNRFIEGQRVNYVHPLRLYLIVSVLFFFLASIQIKQTLEDVGIDNSSDKENAALADSVQQSLGLKQSLAILKDESLTDQEAIDSLRATTEMTMDSTEFANTIFHQIRRVAQNDLDVFVGFILQNMPIMMFLLIPIFALLLKLFYIRRKNWLYVQHLTHSLHLHAFMVFLLTLIVFYYLMVDVSDAQHDLVIFLFLVLFFVYWLFSFRQVYQQGWLKTFLKLSIISLVYFWVFTLFGITEGFISFMMF